MTQFSHLQLVLSYWGLAKHLGRTLVCQTDIRGPESAWSTATGGVHPLLTGGQMQAEASILGFWFLGNKYSTVTSASSHNVFGHHI